MAAETQNAAATFNATFDLLNQAHGENALRRFSNGQPYGRVLLAAYECIAVGVAKNIAHIQAKPNPVDYIHRRITDPFAKPPAVLGRLKAVERILE